jgi:hypothetical protein
MPGSLREVLNAEEEGVVFEWLAAPRAVTGEALEAAGVRAAACAWAPPDASGRQAPEEIDGGDFDLKAHLVIKALGFEPEDLPPPGRPRPDRHPLGHGQGRRPHQMTNHGRRVRRRRHRARRLARRLGDPRRPRRRRRHPPLSAPSRRWPIAAE